MCKKCAEYAKNKDIAFCLQCGAPISEPGKKEASEKNDNSFFKHASLDLDPKDFKERNK